MPKITVITPCYFNELNIPDYANRMIENEKIFPTDVTFEYLLIDDGSKDGTWNEMVKFQILYPEKVKIIKLVRNFGSTNAVFSSLPYSTGDCNVVISADLQDPPELILKMYENWQKGFKLVLANRTNREEPFLQKFVSNTTHKLVQKFGLKNLPDGGFDMNLFDVEIKDILIKMDEKNTFFPFLLMWLGYEFVSIPYVRRKRELGTSTYTLSKKIKAFVDSFVAFSFFPIRLISVSGLILGILAFIYGLIVIFGKVFGFVDSTGWSSMMVVILFVSSFQMIALGIIGEYVWRGLEASRNRPSYLIEKKLGEFK
jgi:glycosyltransferase involved in cell wall biosynthesis